MNELIKKAFAEVTMRDLGARLAEISSNVKVSSFNWSKFREIAMSNIKTAGIPTGTYNAVSKAPSMFSRFANAAPHLNEVAGLGVLAVPSIAGLSGKPMDEHSKDIMEVGGLGMLAAPSAYHAAKSFIPKASKVLGKIHVV